MICNQSFSLWAGDVLYKYLIVLKISKFRILILKWNLSLIEYGARRLEQNIDKNWVRIDRPFSPDFSLCLKQISVFMVDSLMYFIWLIQPRSSLYSAACRRKFFMFWIRRRYPSVFRPVGAHESGLIGEHPNGVPNNLMPYIAQVAEGQRAELSVFGNDYPTADGTGVRDYIHVMDLAEGHAAALGFLFQTTGWHAINLGSGKGYSVIEMLQAFEKASGRGVPYKIVSRRTACYADTQKAGKILNWCAVRTLEDMCAGTWQFENPQKQSVT